MACLECVRACSTAFYKEFHQDKACLKIVERNGKVRPMTCVQCGKCAAACEHGAITQNPKTGEWFLWEYSSILSGIRIPAAEDPWA